MQTYFLVLAPPSAPKENGLKAQVRAILEGKPDRIYQDGIETIDRVEIIDGAIEGEFSDRVGVRAIKRVGFRITPGSVDTWILNPDEVAEFSAYQGDILAMFAPMFGKGSRAKKKNCTKGLSCGYGCLRRTQANGKPTVCSKVPSPELKKKIEAAIGAEEPALKSPDLPANHVLGPDKRITTELLDKALRDLEDDDNRENLAKLRQFVELNKTRAVFYNTGDDLAQATKEKIYKELFGEEDPVLGNYLRPLVELPSKTSNGYTSVLANHVVVSHSKDASGFNPNKGEIKNSVNKVLDPLGKEGTPTPQLAFYSETETQSGQALSVYLHEMGHQVHYAAGEPIAPFRRNASALDYAERMALTATQYSQTNSNEFAAEHFVAWAVSPKKYKETDPVGYNWIDKIVSDSLKKKRFSDDFEL
jgi:hypothetical protein